jgi:hypothetical protein
MDFIDGVDLAELIKAERALLVHESLHIFSRVCDGMAHAHAKGVIHRDLKPSNIMLSDLECLRPTVKLVDFGIAKSIDPAQKDQVQTKTSDLFGSPYYMSPEQALGKPLDARSDIYSLGCIMYETLTGTLPVAGPNPFVTLKMHLTEKPLSIKERCPAKGFSTELERLVMKALAKEPGKRFQSMTELKEAIDNLPEMKAQASSRSGASISPSLGDARSAQAPTLTTKKKTLPVVVPLSLLFLVATGLGAGAFFSQVSHHRELPIVRAGSPAQTGEPSLDDALARLRKSTGAGAAHSISAAQTANIQDPDQQMSDNNKDLLERTAAVSNADNLYPDSIYLKSQAKPDQSLLSELRKKPNVHKVYLDDCSFAANPLVSLKNSKVIGVEFVDCDFPEGSLRVLKDLPNLKIFKFSACRRKATNRFNMTDDVVSSSLKDLKGITVLELASQRQLSYKSLKSLPANIEELVLISDKKIQSDGFEELSRYKMLKKLDLSETAVSDDAIKGLTKLNQLETLILNNTKISDSSVESFLKMPLKNLDIDQTFITRKGLLALAKSLTLEKIFIPRSPTLTEEDFVAFRKVPGNRIHLVPDKPNLPECQWHKILE